MLLKVAGKIDAGIFTNWVLEPNTDQMRIIGRRSESENIWLNKFAKLSSQSILAMATLRTNQPLVTRWRRRILIANEIVEYWLGACFCVADARTNWIKL